MVLVITRIVEVLGPERAYEILELILLLFVLLAAAMFVFLALYEARSRRALRRTNDRMEAIVDYLGRSVFGADRWDSLEQTATHGSKRLDSLIALLDTGSSDAWARTAMGHGRMEPGQPTEPNQPVSAPQFVPRSSSDLASATQPPPDRRPPDRRPPDRRPANRPSAPDTTSADGAPAVGMAVSIRQADAQATGTISELDASTITVWVLNGDDVLDATKSATLMLLSRRGPYTFDTRFRKTGDGTLTIDRPARMVLNQRRRYDRRPAALPAMIKDHLTSDAPTKAVIDELSGGGATLTSSSESFPVGSILKMSFSVGRRRYTAAGRVVRSGSHPGKLHVRFEAMNETERQEIIDYLAETEVV